MYNQPILMLSDSISLKEPEFFHLNSTRLTSISFFPYKILANNNFSITTSAHNYPVSPPIHLK